MVLYYTFSFSTGLSLISKYVGFSMKNVWLEYPVLTYPMDFKVFYMIQCAFYFHLIVLLFTEVSSILFVVV